MKHSTLKIYNLDVINDIYDQLTFGFFPKGFDDIGFQSLASHNECSADPLATPEESQHELQFKTQAGTFYIDGEQGFKMLEQLVSLDSSGLKNRADSVIEGRNFHKSSGFILQFEKFEPSELWDQNRDYLQQYLRQGRIVDSVGTSQQRVLESDQDLWQATTIATLSNLTPNTLELGVSMCAPQDQCIQYFSLFDQSRASWRSGYENNHGQEKIGVIWNLSSSDVSEKAIQYLSAHEQGHILYLKIVAENNQSKLYAHIFKWLYSSDKEKAIRLGKTLKTIQGKELQQFEYYTHETMDPFFLGKVDKQFLQSLKDKWMYIQAHEFQSELPVQDINETQVIRFAYSVVLGRHLGINRTLMSKYLKNVNRRCGVEYQEKLQDYIEWFELVGVYGESHDFEMAMQKHLPSTLVKTQ